MKRIVRIAAIRSIRLGFFFSINYAINLCAASCCFFAGSHLNTAHIAARTFPIVLQDHLVNEFLSSREIAGFYRLDEGCHPRTQHSNKLLKLEGRQWRHTCNEV